MVSTYLPAHVDRSAIRPCIVDMRVPFIDINSEKQAVQQQRAHKSPFIVLEKDYFTVYNANGGPLKCDYISRNYITMMMRYYPKRPGMWCCFQVRNGLTFNPEPPAIYFIHEKSSDILIEDPSECNTVLIYYNEKDIARFAATTRAADGCCNHFFVVYEDGVEQCFDANNPQSSYTFPRTLKSAFLPVVRKGVDAIERFKDEDRLFEERQIFKRLPDGGFKLRDINGTDVHDGEGFSLVVKFDDDDEREFDTYALEIYEGELMARPILDTLFTCETIEGIMYLNYNGQYLHCPDDKDGSIVVSPELPERSDRLQINYDGADILLTRWDTSDFAIYEWVKASVGCIALHGNWYEQRLYGAVRLQLIKV
ncbi:hypothetical protein DL89DRAFT_266267 [Linderina pennispora]|uniref:Uncharacterized protein n=1 Tax=Linderina pennispora TaxID=61395 RepID=A0A1Y1WDD9_9FUNG|nr:uncharacterized protein DL89DRAFT_266267 [Linderina pennispora]ORX71246.1 hypothetical protein DL89DRAFT_266267 [Linderina pennispora]